MNGLCGVGGTLVKIFRDDGMLLRKKENGKLSWEETYKAMSKEQEDWGDFEVILSDGLKRLDYGG
ncbi:MAG: hypothetical protein QTN59_14725 [Candidatus Electrothrix communis]|nr:MAG: hypothetical protein QTN59_14725 [Candidatus Electrothrix communis]